MGGTQSTDRFAHLCPTQRHVFNMVASNNVGGTRAVSTKHRMDFCIEGRVPLLAYAIANRRDIEIIKTIIRSVPAAHLNHVVVPSDVIPTVLLHYAIEYSNYEAVEMMVRHGAVVPMDAVNHARTATPPVDPRIIDYLETHGPRAPVRIPPVTAAAAARPALDEIILALHDEFRDIVEARPGSKLAAVLKTIRAKSVSAEMLVDLIRCDNCRNTSGLAESRVIRGAVAADGTVTPDRFLCMDCPPPFDGDAHEAPDYVTHISLVIAPLCHDIE